MDNERSSDHYVPDGRRPVAMILVIDDEPDTLTALQMALSLFGFEVVIARSAQEALRRVEERLPDLIITDISMPAMSGFELCRELRSRKTTRHIPIIMHTAMDVPGDPSRLYDRLITKPADIEEFVRAIEGLLPPGSRH